MRQSIDTEDRQNFKTADDIQEDLAVKRKKMGYEEFFNLISNALPPAVRPKIPINNDQFGRRFEDDMFWSIQLRYPGVTIMDVRRLTSTICRS